MRCLLLVCAVASVLLSGCNGLAGPTACTEIGCESGLEVVLENAPAVPFRVEAEVPGQQGLYVFDCPDPARCGRVFFAAFTPDYVRIRVTTAAGTVARDVRPQYAEARPNGPDCPPLCRTATVAVPLP